ncbi:hypothetical protein HPB51_007278 [Rhipicephalus microplus]|uniref:Uncharacterized protein n=1 Tax=Rhipicephalus microplus TaxID=6941 RepID=A0A9J6EYQ1_RHIMP|nr:hypothetical protein HPB51_007278 [Rhipicephalus microplus]
MIPLRPSSSYESRHVNLWETEMYFIIHPAMLGVVLLLASAIIWNSGMALAPGELQPPKAAAPPHWLSEVGDSLKQRFMPKRAERRDEHAAYVLGAYADVRVTPPVVRFLVAANGEEKRRHFPPFECRFAFNNSARGRQLRTGTGLESPVTVRSLGTGLDYLSALQRKYEETTSTKDKLHVRLDVAQDDDEAVTSCVYELVTTPFEYALAVTPRDFVVPRRHGTLKEFLQHNQQHTGAMTFLRYTFVGPRPMAGINESSLISQSKVLRSAHAEPPGVTSRALVRVADVVQMNARGGFSLMASASARVMDPRHASVCSYVEDSEVEPDERLAYDDHVLRYGDLMRRSLAWQLHTERLGV